jgi:hypothetical protein
MVSVFENKKPQISVLLTLSVNIIFYGAGVATPDPGEAPPLAGFNPNISGCIISQPSILAIGIQKNR